MKTAIPCLSDKMSQIDEWMDNTTAGMKKQMEVMGQVNLKWFEAMNDAWTSLECIESSNDLEEAIRLAKEGIEELRKFSISPLEGYENEDNV